VLFHYPEVNKHIPEANDHLQTANLSGIRFFDVMIPVKSAKKGDLISNYSVALTTPTKNTKGKVPTNDPP